VALRRVGQDGLKLALEYRLNRGQLSRVAAAHEYHVRILEEGTAEVVHQLDNARLAGEFAAEGR
jgi:hypothetical protein